MFWTFVLLVALAVAFVKLGAASVMVGVLSMGLQAAGFVITVLVGIVLWKAYSK